MKYKACRFCFEYISMGNITKPERVERLKEFEAKNNLVLVPDSGISYSPGPCEICGFDSFEKFSVTGRALGEN
jgi:hypothetical protein